MKKNSHQNFVDNIRIPTEETQNKKNSDLEPDEKELCESLKKSLMSSSDQLTMTIDRYFLSHNRRDNLEQEQFNEYRELYMGTYLLDDHFNDMV